MVKYAYNKGFAQEAGLDGENRYGTGVIAQEVNIYFLSFTCKTENYF